MRIKGVIALVLCFVHLPLSVIAADLYGESRTFLQAKETFDGNTLLPLFEYLDFYVDDLADTDISFHLGGWVRQDLVHVQSFDQRSFNGDLQYAYLGLRKETANTSVNLGRVLVYEGLASELVDGISAGTDLKGGFGISAYGGIPVETDFDDRSGDTIYGGRLSHEVRDLYRVGISYLKEKNGSASYRTEAGLDLKMSPVKKMEMYGQSVYNGETYGWMEHAYYLTLGPFNKLRFNSELSSINYADYFTSVSTSAFSIFRPGIVDPDDKVLLLGGEAEYALREGLTISVDYKSYDYRVAESANSFGGRLAFMDPSTWSAGGSFHRMDGPTDKLQYYEARVYGFKTFGKADITVDLFNVTYDKKISDVKNAYSISVALGFNLAENVRVAADLDYSRNPTFDAEVRGFIKFQFGKSEEGRTKL